MVIVGDAGEHIGEPDLRVDIVELGGLDQPTPGCKVWGSESSALITVRVPEEVTGVPTVGHARATVSPRSQS